MRRTLTLFALLMLTTATMVAAQTAVPITPPQPVTPARPFSETAPPTAVPASNDARLASCPAPNLPNFLPYTVRFGDVFLSDLLIGSTTVTPAQLAALNCLDDASLLPVGATIWLPADAYLVARASLGVNEGPQAATNTAPSIISFTSSPETILNDQGVTFSWQVTGQAAYIYPCASVSDTACVRPPSVAPLPLAGFMTISNFHRAGQFVYRLEVFGGDGTSQPVTQDVAINVTCSQILISGSTTQPCPEEPARTVTAVWQPFQGGVMIWFSDTEQIYVMSNFDGRVRVIPDAYVEGMPDPAAVAPEGLFTPTRGFGQIWEALGGAETSGLGWALAAEIAFDSARQPAGRTSYTTYIQGPGETVYAVTEVPGMELGYWSQVAG